MNRCKSHRLTNLYPARAVALGSLYVVMEDRGLKITENVSGWVDRTASGKVDMEDFEEVIYELRRM